MNALQQLSELDFQAKRMQFPSMPERSTPRRNFKDKDANGLTQCILRCIELHGGYATRIQSQGQFDPRTKRFRSGHTKKGAADVHATICGKHLSIEVKFGKDRLSKAQQKTADLIKNAGGIYVVARDFQTFWDWLQDWLRKEGGQHE